MKSTQNWSDMLTDEIIYQHENATHVDNGFTKTDLMSLCNGKEDTAKRLFALLDWQHPQTLLDEWDIEGEVDAHYNLIGSFNHFTTLSPADSQECIVITKRGNMLQARYDASISAFNPKTARKSDTGYSIGHRMQESVLYWKPKD